MESKSIKVAVWDDRGDQLEALSRSLREAVRGNDRVDVATFSDGEIAAAISELEQKFKELDPKPLAVLNDVDVLCIDYDLRAIRDHTWLTADTLAGLVRAFSDCPCVVVLNRPPRVAFDLSMLAYWDASGDAHLLPEVVSLPETWAPIGFGADQDRFKPWGIPNFFAVKGLVRRQINDLEALGHALADTDVLEFLGFDKDRRSDISWRALGALSGRIQGNDLSLTFQVFLRSGARSLLADKLEMLDLKHDDHRAIAYRVLTFELSRWLREQVVAGQDVLVDLPHLAARARWLLVSKDCYSSLPVLTVDDKQECFPEWIEDYRFEKSHWVGRPVYYWEQLQRDRRFTEGFRDFEDTETNELCFAEDQSRFIPRQDCRDFMAGFGNVWDQRFVGRDRGAHLPYGPLVRFAM